MAVSRAHGVVCFLALSFGILTASGVYERGSSRDGGARAREPCASGRSGRVPRERCVSSGPPSRLRLTRRRLASASGSVATFYSTARLRAGISTSWRPSFGRSRSPRCGPSRPSCPRTVPWSSARRIPPRRRPPPRTRHRRKPQPRGAPTYPHPSTAGRGPSSIPRSRRRSCCPSSSRIPSFRGTRPRRTKVRACSSRLSPRPGGDILEV